MMGLFGLSRSAIIAVIAVAAFAAWTGSAFMRGKKSGAAKQTQRSWEAYVTTVKNLPRFAVLRVRFDPYRRGN